MRIDQVVVAASPGDAVTDAAFAFQELLQRVGPSRVFARYVDPRLEGRVVPLSAHGSQPNPDDVLIYHVSIGEPEVVQFLRERPERLVIIYHNITPAEYFAALDPAFSGLLAGGRSELVLLRERTELALAVSSYNARELVDLGYRDVRVSPLPVDTQALLSLDPDSDVEKGLQDRSGPLVLFVGQLLPHKRPDLLLQAFYVLSTYLLPDAHLALLGPARNERYGRALRTFAAELNLPHVRIPGWLRPEELAAYYRHADLFVTMSEHEGVCVPLVEAMSFGVPVLARASGAIPETMGNGGFLLPTDAGPAVVAEAMAEILTNQRLRSELIQRGRRRLGEFDARAAEASFLGHLAAIV